MGHIHMGYDDIEVPFNGALHRYKVDEQRARIVQALDLFIGVPSLLMEPDNKRRELYGKAGAFRPKPYGLEYRTPSNFYLMNNNLKKWVFNSVKDTFAFINKNGFLQTNVADYVRKTIDNNDKESAKLLINEFKLSLV